MCNWFIVLSFFYFHKVVKIFQFKLSETEFVYIENGPSYNYIMTSKILFFFNRIVQFNYTILANLYLIRAFILFSKHFRLQSGCKLKISFFLFLQPPCLWNRWFRSHYPYLLWDSNWYAIIQLEASYCCPRRRDQVST